MIRFITRNPFFILAVVILYVASSSSHPTSNGGYTGAPGDSVCAQCHTDNNTNFSGEIILDGLPSTVTPGQNYNLTVTVTNNNLNAFRSGFQMTALNESNSKAGNFSGAGPNSSIKTSAAKQYFGHSPAVQFGGGSSLSWDVTWTAPSTGSGELTFYATAILGNGSNGNQDDRFLITQFQTSFASAPLSVNITNVNHVTCFDGNNGTANAMPSGGNSPYEYEWSNGNTNQTANNLTAGIATVTVTDDSGTTATASININEPFELLLSNDNAVDPNCFNSFDGSISVTVTGGSTPYEYNWSNGGFSSSVNNLGPGNYTLTVTDNNDCSFIESFELTAPDAIVIDNFSLENINCFGGNNGSIQIDVSGGAGTLLYDWSNGSSNQDLNNVVAGNYSLTITDGNDCAVDQNFTLTQPALLNSSINVNIPILCNNDNEGSLTAIPTGGTSPYFYQWSTGSNASTINNLSAGNFQVTVTDNKNCTSVKSQTLINPPVLVSSISTTTNASCPGVANGSATLNVSGGINPYTIIWDNGGIGNTVNNLTAGEHSYTITDNLGCQISGTVTIGANQSAQLLEDEVNELLCFGDQNGSITISSLNAQGYNILWSNGQTGVTANNLSAGNYSVVASNASGCISNELSFELENPEQISLLQQNVENVSCFGLGDGRISAAFNGGTGLLSYTWSTGQTTNNISDLIAGNYTISVTDENNCQTTRNYAITQPLQIIIDSVQSNHLNCFNDDNGNIQIYISGGSGTFQPIWSNGDIGNIADTLTNGTYSVIITDTENCSITDTFIIDAPSPMNVIGTIINESETGLNDGSISIEISNGIAPYTYLWSNGETTSAIDSLSPGLYEVVVTDSTGCTQAAQFNIQSGNCALAVTFDVINVSCFGDHDGEVILTPSNGSGPYTITPQTSNLAAGTYDFMITDSLNCSISVNNITVLQPQNLSIKLDSIIAATTNHSDDGEIRITALGGTKPYQFVWKDSLGNIVATAEDPGNLTSGLYTLIMTDANNCFHDSLQFEVSFITSDKDIVNVDFIKIFPNPASSRVYFESTNSDYNVTIFDINGKQISKHNFTNANNNLDISSYSPGLYVLKIVQNHKITTKKLSVE